MIRKWMIPGLLAAAVCLNPAPAQAGAAAGTEAVQMAGETAAGAEAAKTAGEAAAGTEAAQMAGEAAAGTEAAKMAEEAAGQESVIVAGNAAAAGGGSAAALQKDPLIAAAGAGVSAGAGTAAVLFGEETAGGKEDTPAAGYSEEDLSILAHLLAGEAQNCPDEEQLYVGSVVLNRKNHPSFPKTIREVVFQRGQYSCTRDGNYYREPTERNWANAKKLLEEGSVLPGHVIWQSGSRQGNGVYLKTKYHYYCY